MYLIGTYILYTPIERGYPYGSANRSAAGGYFAAGNGYKDEDGTESEQPSRERERTAATEQWECKRADTSHASYRIFTRT